MVCSLARTLFKLGLPFKHPSLRFHNAESSTEAIISLPRGRNYNVARCTRTMSVPGALVSSRNIHEEQVKHRLKAASGRFFMDIDFYRCKGIPLGEKLKRLCKQVAPCALHPLVPLSSMRPFCDGFMFGKMV